MELKNVIKAKDFVQLQQILGWKYIDENIIKKSIKNSMFCVSALEDNKVIGIARIVGDGFSHALLCDVMVHPQYQKKGVGKSMINQLLARLQEYVNKHCDEFILELLPTTANIEFYKKCCVKNDSGSTTPEIKLTNSSNVIK